METDTYVNNSDGWKKMDYIKKHNMFAQVGENCYFQSNILPAEPFLVYLHNNVAISAGVRLVTHSAVNTVLITKKYRYLFMQDMARLKSEIMFI